MKRLETESSKEFSYRSDISVLEGYYQKQYDMIRNGNTDLVTLELVMLGNALDFISFVKDSFGMTLDSDEKSVEVYDEVMDALSRGIVQVNLFDKENNIAGKAGAYLGFLILANIGGEWADTNTDTAVILNGREVYVMEKTRKRLLSESGLNAVDYYKAVKALK